MAIEISPVSLTQEQAETVLAAFGWTSEDWNGFPNLPGEALATACANDLDRARVEALAALDRFSPMFAADARRITHETGNE